MQSHPPRNMKTGIKFDCVRSVHVSALLKSRLNDLISLFSITQVVKLPVKLFFFPQLTMLKLHHGIIQTLWETFDLLVLREKSGHH